MHKSKDMLDGITEGTFFANIDLPAPGDGAYAMLYAIKNLFPYKDSVMKQALS